jgi:beta-glucosidase/6-phospho-beta-glucosidase/beta-galactosidase
MSESFLSTARRQLGSVQGEGDQQGGAVGPDSRGLPTGVPNNFWFATGIECSYPTIEHGRVRRDLLEETCHYKHWRDDLRLVEELGLKYLRYGLPYYRMHLGPGRYDWDFADQVIPEIQRRKITPIMDLLHFGVPDWLGNLQNPEMPGYFAEFAEAFAIRYPSIRFYTPVNEMYVCAKFSALDGCWNEQLKSDRAFVTAIKHLVAASILAAQKIAHHRPDAVFIQSESAEYIHDMRAQRDGRLQLQNDLRFLALDLLYARPPDSNVTFYMLDNGLTREEYDWFLAGKPPGYQVMGNDYYGRNEKLLLPDGSMVQGEDLMGWYGITKGYYYRYYRPLMYTETNVLEADDAPRWLWKQFSNVLRMRRDGIPVLGFTWYSLIDQMDWDIGLSEKRGTVNACGLYDLDRRPRPVAESYKMLLREYGRMSLIAHAEMFALTDQPARLRKEF